MALLFLDFDGVLHPASPQAELSAAENTAFSYLPRLENALREVNDLQVVIASDWRLNHSLTQLRTHFSDDIAARIIGITPNIDLKWPPYPKHIRHMEIMLYLKHNDRLTTPWLALDHSPQLFPEGCEQLIICRDGFRDAHAALLRAYYLSPTN